MCTDPDGVKSAQYIGLCHYQLADPVEHNGIFQGRQINPAAATGTPGSSAKFMSLLPQLLPGLIFQLSGEGASAYAGAIGFENPNHFTDAPGCDAEACAGSRGGRSDERRVGKGWLSRGRF